MSAESASRSHFLEKEDFRRLRIISSRKAVFGLLRVWLPVVVVFFVWIHLEGQGWRWALLPLFWLIIVSRQHALAAIAHDSVHRILFTKSFANDWVGRILGGFPILVSLSRYRAIHLEHHRSLYTKTDPDLQIYDRYPVNLDNWRRYLWRDLRGATVLKNLAYFVDLSRIFPDLKMETPDYTSDTFSLCLFHAAIMAIFVWSGHFLDFILLWWIPYLTLLQVLLRIRAALEHGALPFKTNPFQNTRTVEDNPFILSVFAPVGLNYHLEHHIYPTIPWYNLHEVNAKLKASGIDAKIDLSYRVALKDLTRR